MRNEIVIVQWENDGNRMDGIINNNVNLSDAIDEYFNQELSPLGLTLLIKMSNIIITDVMCYAALFENDLTL